MVSIISPAVQDVIASVFASELEFGVDDYPDGTDAKFYARLADIYLKAAQASAKRGTLTFGELMLGNLYQCLACEDLEQLRYFVTGLIAQGVQWREALDRRVTQ